MSRFLLSPRARADLSGIWDYTAGQWGIEQAERYVRQIVAACNELAEGRAPGRSAEDVRAGYLKQRVGSHMLYFRKGAGGTVEIIRILHQRMDAECHL